MENISGTFGLVVIGFIVLLLILWVVLPFAVFGIKDKLKELNDNLIRTGHYQREILEELKAQREEKEE